MLERYPFRTSRQEAAVQFLLQKDTAQAVDLLKAGALLDSPDAATAGRLQAERTAEAQLSAGSFYDAAEEIEAAFRQYRLKRDGSDTS
jgi:hypothetical protein